MEESAWNRKWLHHPDARIALFFDLWQTRLVYSTVGPLNRANGTSRPSTGGTDKLIRYIHAAEGLRIRGVPVLPDRPLNEMELDAEYQMLRNAIRENVAPSVAADKRSGKLSADGVDKIRRLVLKVDQQITSADKGLILEDLIAQLLETVTGFTVQQRIHTQTEEIDLFVLNDSANTRWKNDGPLILCECKNWSGKCGKNEMVLFKAKIENRRDRCKLGILVSWNGFAETVTKELLRSSGRDVLIIMLTGEDIRRFLTAESFESILETGWQASVVV